MKDLNEKKIAVNINLIGGLNRLFYVALAQKDILVRKKHGLDTWKKLNNYLLAIVK